jgi:thiol-disulfide isomerase/thioredoxin
MNSIKKFFLLSTVLLLGPMQWGNVQAQTDYRPDLSMSLSEFESQALQEKEEVWVVDFWASWCGPCIQAVPHMKDLHSTWESKGVRFISISWDSNPAKWQSAMMRLQMPWQHIIVPKGKEAYLEETFPHRGIPTAFVIRRDGKVKKVNDVYALDKAIGKAVK